MKDNEAERASERASSGLVSDLIKLALTSYDGHLSHAAVGSRLTLIPPRQGLYSESKRTREAALLVVKQWRQA